MVRGNEQQFREHEWQREGVSGGIRRFELHQPVGPDAEVTATGRVLYDQGDYGLSMGLANPEQGFVRGGFDIYRKYFNNVGGDYPRFRLAPLALDQDLLS